MSNPKSNRKRHEHKLEQDPGFKSSYEPSSRTNPKLRAGNADRDPRPRFDERESVILTGRYRDQADRYHLFINQAGTHLELLLALVDTGWKSEKVPTDAARSQQRIVLFGGDIDPAHDGFFDLYFRREGGFVDDKTLACGRLRSWTSGSSRIVEIDLDLSGVDAAPGDKGLTEKLAKLEKIGKSRAKQFDDSPNLFPQHLNHGWIPAEVRTMHWFPLTPTQAARLPTHILDVRIHLSTDDYLQRTGGHSYEFSYVELLRHFAEPYGSDPDASHKQKQQWRANIATALNELVKKSRSDAMTLAPEKGGIDGHQEHHWRDATLEALHDEKLELVKGSLRSLLTHTQDVLDSAPVGSQLDHFEKYLYLQPISGGHYYSAEMTLVDLGGAKSDIEEVLKKVSKQAKKVLKKVSRRFPFGAFAGALTVKKPDPGGFTANYVVLLGGGKFSLSAGTSFTTATSAGEAKHVYGRAWRPEHIPGVAAFREIGAAAFIGGGGQGASGTVLRCHGSGAGKPTPPLQINFSGFSDLFSAGAGAGISAMLYWGTIFAIDADGGEVDMGVPETDTSSHRYAASAGPLHFPINGAVLEPAACELLQIFAACELAVLGRPGVMLELHGYADQPHDELSNAILSRNRAMSAYVYLENILGKDLATSELQAVPPEQDEISKAKKSGDPKTYRIADPSAKDGSVIVVAHGEPEDRDGTGKAEYDQGLRRVELMMNGDVRLVLRRTKDD